MRNPPRDLANNSRAKSLRRTSQIALFFCLMSVSGIIFQNCGPVTPLKEDKEDLGSTAGTGDVICTGTSCELNPEGILLKIGNYDPIKILAPDTENKLAGDLAFDLGGFCDAANYPSNEIVYTLTGAAPGIAATTIKNGCDSLGRFRLLITLPAGYKYTSKHTLSVRLYGIDKNNKKISNPLSLDRKSIDVIAQ